MLGKPLLFIHTFISDSRNRRRQRDEFDHICSVHRLVSAHSFRVRSNYIDNIHKILLIYGLLCTPYNRHVYDVIIYRAPNSGQNSPIERQ